MKKESWSPRKPNVGEKVEVRMYKFLETVTVEKWFPGEVIGLGLYSVNVWVSKAGGKGEVWSFPLKDIRRHQ